MFNSYKTSPFFDEMFTSEGKPKAHYEKFYEILSRFREDELKESMKWLSFHF